MLNIYLGHAIRGKFGNNATPESMKANCDQAINFANWLRIKFGSIAEFYVPGEMDEFLTRRKINPSDLVPELLRLDCGIINHSEGMILYSPDDCVSCGMILERDYAELNDIPVCHVTSINSGSDQLLEQVVYNFLEGLK